MRWGYKIPLKENDNTALEISFEVNDEIIKELTSKEMKDNIKNVIEFEYFLMSANRFKMAVLDEQTLSFIIINYDAQKERILATFTNLAQEMAKNYDNTSTNNSQKQPESVIDAD